MENSLEGTLQIRVTSIEEMRFVEMVLRRVQITYHTQGYTIIIPFYDSDCLQRIIKFLETIKLAFIGG